MGNSVAACGRIIINTRVAPEAAAAAAAAASAAELGSFDIPHLREVEDLQQAEVGTIDRRRKKQDEKRMMKAESKVERMRRRIGYWGGKQKRKDQKRSKRGELVARLVYCDGHVQEIEGARRTTAQEVLKRAPYNWDDFLICESGELSAFTELIGGGSGSGSGSGSRSSSTATMISCRSSSTYADQDPAAAHRSCSAHHHHGCSSSSATGIRQLAADDVLLPGFTYFLLPAHIFQLHNHGHNAAEDQDHHHQLLLLRGTSGSGGAYSAASAARNTTAAAAAARCRPRASSSSSSSDWSPSLRTIDELLLA